uniref:Major sperm protein n=1 Tax=Trichuris muris TaxID=70415 RepID=A0A5S6PZB1_TRIMR
MGASPQDENYVLKQISIDNDRFNITPSNKEEKSEKVRITNPTNSSVAFKVKSTRPHLLVAAPAFGVIKPQSGMTLKVKFHKLTDNNFAATKDRLTIVIAVVNEKTYVTTPTFWKGPNGPPKIQKRLPIAISYSKASPFDRTLPEESPEEVKPFTLKALDAGASPNALADAEGKADAGAKDETIKKESDEDDAEEEDEDEKKPKS